MVTCQIKKKSLNLEVLLVGIVEIHCSAPSSDQLDNVKLKYGHSTTNLIYL